LLSLVLSKKDIDMSRLSELVMLGYSRENDGTFEVIFIKLFLSLLFACLTDLIHYYVSMLSSRIIAYHVPVCVAFLIVLVYYACTDRSSAVAALISFNDGTLNLAQLQLI